MEGTVIFKNGFVPSVLKLSWLTMTKLTCWPAASSQGKHHSRRKKKGEKRSQTLNLPIQTLSQSQAGRNSSFMGFSVVLLMQVWHRLWRSGPSVLFPWEMEHFPVLPGFPMRWEVAWLVGG